MVDGRSLKTSANRRWIALACIAVLARAWSATPARADGPRTPFVVARGHSLHGVPWQVRFGEERGHPDRATFLFSIGDAAERRHNESGFYSSIPLPLPPAFPFAATFGSGLDRFPEADMSGTTGPRVASLVLKMADGSNYEAELLRAPERLLGRFPALARFRFFDLFFPESAEPVLISAYARGGVLLKRERGPAAPRAHP
jgi:hypothetical protein